MTDKPRFIAVRHDVFDEMVSLIVNRVKMPYSKASALVQRIENGSQAVTDEVKLSNNVLRKQEETCAEEEEES